MPSDINLSTVPQRIVVQGPSGSGKSTLATALARALGIPYLELDSMYHLPGWTALDEDMFRGKVARFASQPRWVSDGNYRVVRDLLWCRADLIVFIDLPRRQVIARLLRRTIRRALWREELWNGNRESLRNLISRDPERNIVLWSWNTHARYRDTVPDEARADAPHAEVRVLRGAKAVESFRRNFGA
ncbi:MAG TPA: (d)CMP kinase [Acidimicrobiales bacterium]|nr:(d)CMP kinase [Acidimicrobiales bacterium]